MSVNNVNKMKQFVAKFSKDTAQVKRSEVNTMIYTDCITFAASPDDVDEITPDGKSWKLEELISLIKTYTKHSQLYLTVKIYETGSDEQICEFNTDAYFKVIG